MKQAIESTAKQPCKDMEIIVRNDGSTDLTLSIVSQLVKMDDRTIILDHENVGAGSARKPRHRTSAWQSHHFSGLR
ncbi:glycosyltransferase [Collinsella bouchesdurhonensis]|uniref:glycosyltransferase n=1 Tax=Collinsella bouchesdurhonensis TaxID=1907654 RepID=UPI0035656F2B